MERKMTRKEAFAEVERLSLHLPEPTPRQLAWVRETFVPKVAVWYTNNCKAWCSRCGESFTYEKCDRLLEQTVCPHCGAKLKMENSRALTVSGAGYWSIITVFRGWQVVRFFRCECKARKKQADRQQLTIFPAHEVMQKWFKPGMEPVTMSVQTTMYPGYYDNAYGYGELKVRRHQLTYWMRQWFNTKICPGSRILPVFRKAGFDGIRHLNEEETFGCFCNPYLEALYKAIPKDGHLTQEMKDALDNVEGICRRWPSIRIALKHGMRFGKDVRIGDYLDYLGHLQYVNKDIRSPHWLVPEDFALTNARVIQMVTNKQDRARRTRDAENEKRAFEAALKHEKKFLSEKRRYLGLVFQGSGIIIRPLQSIVDFRAEADFMHHCVFSNGYYRHTDALILSARLEDTGARLETIEVNLNSFKVVQSRGKYNGKTAYHDQILSIMEKAAPAIRRAKHSKIA